jgi:hypothetical protein
VGPDSCAAIELKALAEVVGAPESEPATTELDGIEHPALHGIRCTVTFTPPDAGAPGGTYGDGWTAGYQAAVTAELHKETDPRAVMKALKTE